MRARGAVVVATTVAVFAATAAYAIVQQRRADDAEARLRTLSERPAPSPTPTSDDLLEEYTDLLEDLGGGNSGALGDIGDLFGGSGGADLLECIGGDAIPGSSGSDGGGIGGLLEGIGEGEGAETGDALEGLFGGGSGEERSARREVKRIASAVEKIRKLRFDNPVQATFASPAQVSKRASRLFLEDYPSDMAEAEGRLLIAFGAIPPGTDLRRTIQRLLESQVAGFYVPETNELVVPATDPAEPLTATEKTILAHELEHALADQRLALPASVIEVDPGEGDEALAALGVVEGDATLTMQRYSLQEIALFEQLSMLSDPQIIASQQAMEEVPSYLVKQIQFPYIDGLRFTCALMARGGWAAIDRAYSNPPDSTAQVLFPERYLADEHVADPPAPGNPGPVWRRTLHTSFGAANLEWLFTAPGGNEAAPLDDARSRAGAWGGGEVTVWERGPDSAVGLALLQRPESSGLCDSISRWYRAAFPNDRDGGVQGAEQFALDGDDQDAVLWCSNDSVRLGIGPTVATARAITH